MQHRALEALLVGPGRGTKPWGNEAEGCEAVRWREAQLVERRRRGVGCRNVDMQVRQEAVGRAESQAADVRLAV